MNDQRFGDPKVGDVVRVLNSPLMGIVREVRTMTDALALAGSRGIVILDVYRDGEPVHEREVPYCFEEIELLQRHAVGETLPNGRTKGRIYVASSWRNELQPTIVRALRSAGHEVYDFRAPAPGVSGFSWSEIDPNWQSWTPAEYREALKHPIAKRGYGYDIAALRACTSCVLVLPSGRSASWEFGFAMARSDTYCNSVVAFHKCEPELMYLEANIITSIDELHAVYGARLDEPMK